MTGSAVHRAVSVVVLGLSWLGLVTACASADGPGPTTTRADGPVTTTSLEGPEATMTTTTPALADRATVTQVTDGDTIDVVISGRPETVRLVGINTPEDGECFADEATAALDRLVGGETVRLVPDRTDRDQYGRLLRYVYTGDALVNEVLVRDGFAIAYRYEPDTARADQFDAAQDAAESDEVGLWAPDACGHAGPGEEAVRISRVEADPPGDDTLDPNAEWVQVHNGGTVEVDLTGWGLKDESSSHRFVFPAGFSLPAAAVVTVHTGCGAPSATDLFWCNEGSAIWNNDGDTAFLLDPSGNVVDSRSY